LDVAAVERYAGSLIVSARNRPRGIPALELRSVTRSDFDWVGIDLDERPPRMIERTMVEAVVELLIRNEICLLHEGMLIFPSLFEVPVDDGARQVAEAVSLHYDFAGAIDTIYSSLVVTLAMSGNFGQVRLGDGWSEFGRADLGTCGISRADKGNGYGHLDIYFSEDVELALRRSFVSYLDNHLRQQGVDVQDHLALTCECGHAFAEDDLRRRLAGGATDIGCVRCDRRYGLEDSVQRSAARGQIGRKEGWALRTEVESRKADALDHSRLRMAQEDHPRDEVARILHLSDLHLSADDDIADIAQSLVSDVQSVTDVAAAGIDVLLVTGDLTQRATPEEFEAAHALVSRLIDAFSLSSARCVIVPGNHDLDWNTEVYRWIPRRSMSGSPDPRTSSPQGSGYLVRDDDAYGDRFGNFSTFFYHPLMQRPYPAEPADQGIVTNLDDLGLQFLAFNSAWEIDEYFPERSALHPGAVGRCIQEADTYRATTGQTDLPLRIAVWHHPVTGQECMADTAFLSRLKQAEVRLCLHGHVHRDVLEQMYVLEADHRLHVIAAGSFGAVATDRPESTPRLYNVLSVDPGKRTVRVDTRSKPTPGSAWGPWTRWPSDVADHQQSYYELSL